ncbi:MAG: dephospho-CoA kinase [Polyangiales bacterium]
MGVPVVGLTGGIASGKSTVARVFAELGIPVIDADKLAREVVAPGSEGLAAIVATFGSDVLLADGTLDRKALAARVFADPALRLKLNAITHPLVGKLSAERIAAAEGTAPYVLYEAPLLVETGRHKTMAALVVVALDAELQVARVKLRDAMSHEEATARIGAQASLAEKLAAANYVIDNHGDPADLRAQVEQVHRALLSRLGGS